MPPLERTEFTQAAAVTVAERMIRNGHALLTVASTSAMIAYELWRELEKQEAEHRKKYVEGCLTQDDACPGP